MAKRPKTPSSTIESPMYMQILQGLSDTVIEKQARTPVKPMVDFVNMAFVGSEGKAVTKAEVVARDTMLGKENPLIKSVLNVLNGSSEDSIERLAFESNPAINNSYQTLYKRKLRLLPDELLKRLAIQDDLVASIVMVRAAQVSAFGRPQPDRFSTGFKIELEPGVSEKMNPEQKKAIQAQISRAEKLIMTCGQTRGYDDHEALGFAHYLSMTARNAVVFGRAATEIIWYQPIDSSEKKFHSFRPIDAGTIYKATNYKQAAQKVRDESLAILERIKNKKLIPEKFMNDDYPWVQVIDGVPRQAFTSSECLVHNFYPITDIEMDGYPITPMDTIITSITTHINIGSHNKLYFQSGRAARGMIVIHSDDVDEAIIGRIRQQFMASINSVGNSWRMPVFGVGKDDDISWMPIDNSARDMEFQYLSDTNSRVILSAFQMSPEEIAGYAHLSRGTNSQALSESNNQYQLEAARDTGIRPLLAQIQNYVNQRILPLIDGELAKIASIKFIGLDVETAEKESTRLQQDQAVHMSMDEVLEKVQKKEIGEAFGGRFLMNPQWGAILDKYCYQGEIMEHFFKREGASKDATLKFINNPNWFQWQTLLMQMQQQQAQAQAQQQQAAQGGQPGQGGQEGGEQPAEGQSQDSASQSNSLSDSTDKLQSVVKSEKQLSSSQKTLLLHNKKVVENVLQGFERDSEIVLKMILENLPKEED